MTRDNFCLFYCEAMIHELKIVYPTDCLVALMAHLLVSNLATDLWEEISERTPTIGAASSNEVNGNFLISVADNIKTTLDLTPFSSENCGVEAALALKNIDPSVAVFANAKELLSLRTTYVKQHDELLQHLDCCSGSFSEEDTVMTRRMQCFESFIGAPGGNKNIGLFYCFLLWEGKNTHLLKRLPKNVRRCSSDTNTNNIVTTNSLSNSIILTKKQLRQVEMIRQVIHTSASSLENDYNHISHPATSSSVSNFDSTSLENVKKRYISSKISLDKSNKLQRAIESTAFALLDTTSQKAVQDKWLEVLLND
jgi:hypothetical protein